MRKEQRFALDILGQFGPPYTALAEPEKPQDRNVTDGHATEVAHL
jgi:hypothetical protein